MVKIIRMKKVENIKHVKAFFDVDINDIKIKGVKILESEKGLYVGFPREKGKDGRYYAVVFPSTEPLTKEIEKVLLEYYKNN